MNYYFEMKSKNEKMINLIVRLSISSFDWMKLVINIPYTPLNKKKEKKRS